MTAKDVIKQFGLEPLPIEGGFFRQIYQAGQMVPTETLGTFAKPQLPLFTVIYYVITPDSFSALHRLTGSEVWSWIAGGSLEQVIVLPSGEVEKRHLGFGENEEPVSVIPPGSWQGTKLIDGEYGLCSVIVSPGYDEGDFTIADSAFIEKYPQLQEFLAP